MKPNSFKLEIETLSPLHIGDGSTLIPLEYVLEDGLVKVVNLDFLLEALPEKIASQLGEKMVPMHDFLNRKNQGHLLRKPELYSRKIKLSDGARGDLKDDLDPHKTQINKAQIKTFVKTGGKPFIPGSSIKGAIRTALAYHILKEARGEKVEKILDASVKRERDRDRDAVEKYLLRADDDIDEDILMLLGITDSAAVEADHLVVVRGKRLASRSFIPTGYYEALPTGIKTTFRVFFNEFGDGVQRRRDASLIPTTPQKLFAILNEFARDLIDFEKRQNAKIKMQKRGDLQKYLPDFERIIKFCDNLEAKMRDNPNAGFMALGWGTGWHSKTVGILLNKDPEKFLRMYAYKMGRPPRGNWKPDPAFFPKTREVIVGQDTEPLFGWVMLRLKED